MNFGGEVTPDLTIYLDLAPATAIEIVESRNEGMFTVEDIRLQAACFQEELASLPKGSVGIIDAGKAEEQIAAEALVQISKIL